MDNQRLHVSHISQQRKYLQVVNEVECFLLRAVNLKGKYRASTVGEVAFVQVVVGMQGQRGVIYLLYLRLFLQILNHFLRVKHMPLNAQAQRFKALQQHPCVKRRYTGALIAQQQRPDAGNKRRGELAENQTVV